MPDFCCDRLEELTKRGSWDRWSFREMHGEMRIATVQSVTGGRMVRSVPADYCPFCGEEL